MAVKTRAKIISLLKQNGGEMFRDSLQEELALTKGPLTYQLKKLVDKNLIRIEGSRPQKIVLLKLETSKLKPETPEIETSPPINSHQTKLAEVQEENNESFKNRILDLKLETPEIETSNSEPQEENLPGIDTHDLSDFQLLDFDFNQIRDWMLDYLHTRYGDNIPIEYRNFIKIMTDPKEGSFRENRNISYPRGLIKTFYEILQHMKEVS